MASKLFVGGLPYSMQDAQLSELFAQIGQVVSATIIIDKFSGRSKGFGFVEMSTEEEAQAALSLNGTDVGGRSIIVNIARPMEPRDSRGGGGGGFNRGGGSSDRRSSGGGSSDRRSSGGFNRGGGRDY